MAIIETPEIVLDEDDLKIIEDRLGDSDDEKYMKFLMYKRLKEKARDWLYQNTGNGWCAFKPMKDKKAFFLATKPGDVWDLPEEEWSDWDDMLGPLLKEDVADGPDNIQ